MVRYQYMWYSHPQQTFLADLLQKSRKSRVSHTDLTAPRAIVIRLSWNCIRLSNKFQRSAHKSYSQLELLVCWELCWTTPHTPDIVQAPLGLAATLNLPSTRALSPRGDKPVAMGRHLGFCDSNPVRASRVVPIDSCGILVFLANFWPFLEILIFFFLVTQACHETRHAKT